MSIFEKRLQRVGMSRQSAHTLLMTVAMAWGMSYVLMKIGGAALPPFEVLALRFTIASVICTLLFRRRLAKADRRTVIWGALVGVLIFAGCAAIIFGTKTTEASTAAFLTSTSIVIVPLVQTVRKRRLPEPLTIVCTLMAMGGIALLSFKSGFALSGGAVLCLFGAVLYAAFTIITDAIVRKTDALALGVIQLITMAIVGWVCTLIFSTPVMPHGRAEWGAILGLALICSAFAFVAQPYAQRFSTPERTALILAMEPVWGAVFSFIILAERFTLQTGCGALLVLISVFLSSGWQPRWLRRRKKP